jgi:NhaP-type Na+/H+ or K+/H+ antiporter
MFGLRWLLMTLEAPLLSLVGPRLSWQEVMFSALGGLRGGLALILAQTVLASHGATRDPQLKVRLCIWFVFFPLAVPSI